MSNAPDLPLFRWADEQTALVIPFPAVRRKAFIAKHAATAARRPYEDGERYLFGVLQRHLSKLIDRGIPEDAAHNDAARLAIALWSELNRLHLAGAVS